MLPKDATEFKIPYGVEKIEWEAINGYEYNELTSVTIPDGVQEIKSQAFLSPHLIKISIGKDVRDIEEGAFFDCNTSEFIVSPSNAAYTAIDGMLYTKDRKTLLGGSNGKDGKVLIP